MDFSWIASNSRTKTLIIIFLCSIIAFAVGFGIGFDFGVRKVVTKGLDILTTEQMQGFIKWGCTSLVEGKI